MILILINLIKHSPDDILPNWLMKVDVYQNVETENVNQKTTYKKKRSDEVYNFGRAYCVELVPF